MNQPPERGDEQGVSGPSAQHKSGPFASPPQPPPPKPQAHEIKSQARSEQVPVTQALPRWLLWGGAAVCGTILLGLFSMTALNSILSLAAVAAFVIGVLGLIRGGLPRLHLPERTHAAMLLGFAVLLSVLVSYLGYPGPESRPAPTQRAGSNSETGTPQAPPVEALEVTDWTWGPKGYGVIQGTLRNNSGRKYSYVEVRFNLYDDSGAQIGNTMANVNNLEPYGTWKFEAPLRREHGAKTGTLSGVKGFVTR
jgi:hypothetical protein